MIVGVGLFEQRGDPALPLDRGGLNAPADIREGRYGRGDVLDLLRADLEAVTGHPAPRPSRALTRIDPPHRGVAVVEPLRAPAPDKVIDAEFEVVAQSATVRNVAPVHTRMPPLEELREMLIAQLFEALQEELLRREAALRRAGALSSIKMNVLEAHERAMLGVAYVIDLVASKTAIGTFLPGNASWAYGLVGPVLIGGLGSLGREKIDRIAAVGQAGRCLSVWSRRRTKAI